MELDLLTLCDLCRSSGRYDVISVKFIQLRGTRSSSHHNTPISPTPVWYRHGPHRRGQLAGHASSATRSWSGRLPLDLGYARRGMTPQARGHALRFRFDAPDRTIS